MIKLSGELCKGVLQPLHNKRIHQESPPRYGQAHLVHTIVGVKMQSYLMKVANSSIELRTFFILPSQSRSGSA